MDDDKPGRALPDLLVRLRPSTTVLGAPPRPGATPPHPHAVRRQANRGIHISEDRQWLPPPESPTLDPGRRRSGVRRCSGPTVDGGEVFGRCFGDGFAATGGVRDNAAPGGPPREADDEHGSGRWPPDGGPWLRQVGADGERDRRQTGLRLLPRRPRKTHPGGRLTDG